MDPQTAATIVARVLDIYIELVSKVLKRLNFRFDNSGISINFRETSSIDKRIAKIDEAKSSLLEGVRLIDELRDAAENNKREAELAITQINKLEADKANIQQELDAIRKIAETDISTFKRMVGIPSAEDIRRERIIGFVSGVLSSVIASALIALIVWLISLIF